MAPRGCSLRAFLCCALALVLCAGCRTSPRIEYIELGRLGDEAPEWETAAETRGAIRAARPGLEAGETGTQSGETGGVLHLAEAAQPETAPASSHQARADMAYQAKDFELACREYLATVNEADSEGRVPDQTWLRLAQIAYYENRDVERSIFYARRASPQALPGVEREALERLLRRLSRRELGPEAIGLGDGNVSALQVDGDDLWIGTWNGGVCRLSLASGETMIFRQGRESLVPATVRCIVVTPARVWIGTYQGLFVYSKSGGTWQEIGRFGGRDPFKVESLCLAGGRLYVGTLGQGLWRQEGEGWRRVSAGLLPGDFVTCLEADGEELLIGTLTQGVVQLNLSSLALRSFDQGGLAARNITMLTADPPRGFWIGTYGTGLYYWDRQASRLGHFTRAGGHLGDDWVLCAARAASGTYFGTLGGGLARHSRGAWEVLGLREGIIARDIPALAYGRPFLYLGSLGSGVTVLREAEL